MLEPLVPRKHFPILASNDVAYLDGACVTPTPETVIERQYKCAGQFLNCTARGLHRLSRTSTAELDRARMQIADFFGSDPAHIIITYGTTDAINLLAGGFRRGRDLKIGLCDREHSSNLLPWWRRITD